MQNIKIFRKLPFILIFFLLSACSSTPTQESTGQFFDSSLITAKIKAQLIDDPITSASHIKVNTFKSQVELTGTVESLKEKQRAEEIAREITGVKGVTNKLVIKRE